MNKIITLGLQKGGVSKTTTTGALSYLLSKSKKKVLAVDMDSQGNLTEMLSGVPSNEFIGNSVLEAIAFKQPERHIFTVSEHLDLLPANNYLASLGRWIYTRSLPNTIGKVGFQGDGFDQLNQTLKLIRDQYDYIIIDTPPALSEQTTNALMASSHVIIPYESSKFCFTAVPNFMESVEYAQKNGDNNLRILGILRTLNDGRRNDSKFFNEKIDELYPGLCFDTVLNRRAATGRLSLYGFDEENKELKDALEQFRLFYREFLNRLGEEVDEDEEHGRITEEISNR